MGLASFYVVVNESARILTAFSCQLFGSDVKVTWTFHPISACSTCRCRHSLRHGLSPLWSSQSKLRPPVTEGYTDLLVFALLSMLLFVLNWGFRKAVVEPVAARLLGVSSTRAKVQKFAQVRRVTIQRLCLFHPEGITVLPCYNTFTHFSIFT